MVKLFKNKKFRIFLAKFHFRGTIPGNVPNISEKICWFLPRFQGIFTKVVFLENVRVSLPLNQLIFRVTIPGNKLISGYCYLEINLFPGNNTRKSIDFWVSCPENRYEKSLISWISPRKRKYFRKYFSMWIQGPGTIDSWKNQRSKISCYSPFNIEQIN